MKLLFWVFTFSVVSELFCIKILRGSLAPWFHNPHRLLLLLSLVLVNLLNAATALYFCSRAVKAEVVLKLNERKQQRAGLYLNHHLRHALTVIQNAAFLTNNEQAIELCNEAVKRIVSVLVRSESGLPDPSEALFDTE